eukprot:29192-Pelagococcus_subviridis.AAC.9
MTRRITVSRARGGDEGSDFGKVRRRRADARAARKTSGVYDTIDENVARLTIDRRPDPPRAVMMRQLEHLHALQHLDVPVRLAVDVVAQISHLDRGQRVRRPRARRVARMPRGHRRDDGDVRADAESSSGRDVARRRDDHLRGRARGVVERERGAVLGAMDDHALRPHALECRAVRDVRELIRRLAVLPGRRLLPA